MNTAALQTSTPTARELSARINAEFPRCGFAHLPTPLERMENLSRSFDINLFIKRDDQTGLAFGGNKTRKLDLIMADVVAKGCDTIVTWAGIQSNWCRQTVAAARRIGLKPILVLFQRPNLPSAIDGNYFVDLLFNSDVKIVQVETNKNILKLAEVAEIIEETADEEKRKGNKPYIAPIGGSITEGSMTAPLGSIAYVGAFTEIAEQAADMDFEPDYVVLASGSGSTHSGLIAGSQLLSPQTKIVGISVSSSRDELAECVKSITEETLEALGESPDLSDGVIAFDEYNKDGYGVLNQGTVDAVSFVAETEGILLDPVYTGKAMAGLLDLIDKGYFARGSNVVFLHSGGTPALFPYRDEILKFMGNGHRRNDK